nr:hypothetical protein [Tanacetum cinerariifolium]
MGIFMAGLEESEKIINLCFADDLFLFARGHPSSVNVIMQGLKEFKNISGLVLSISKSTTFFYTVPNALKDIIFNSMPFAEGSLPVGYLGVPLISSRLLYRDFKILVENLNDFVFILPARIIHDLEHLMRSFLWCQCEMKKGKAKVAWESVCKPKLDGGLEMSRSGFGLSDSVTDFISKRTGGVVSSSWSSWNGSNPLGLLIFLRILSLLPRGKKYILLNKEKIRIEESLNVTFDESFPEPKSSSLVEDDRIIEAIVQNPVRSPSLEVNASKLGYPKSLKEARGHPIKQVIGELNERTLRSKTKQA